MYVHLQELFNPTNAQHPNISYLAFFLLYIGERVARKSKRLQLNMALVCLNIRGAKEKNHS
jgi:hypothetical protein